MTIIITTIINSVTGIGVLFAFFKYFRDEGDKKSSYYLQEIKKKD